MQHHHRDASAPGRRRFLRNAAGAGALAAALPLAAATTGPGSGLERGVARATPAPRTRGYRVTEHVAAYYRSARA